MRSLSRTSVAVAALMVAVSVIIGVGIMVGSFRNSVANWLDDMLQADIFISSPTTESNQLQGTLDPVLAVQVAGLPNVIRTATTRSVYVSAFLSEGDEESIPVRLVAFSGDLAGPDRRHRQSTGAWRTTWRALEAGGIIINEPLPSRWRFRRWQRWLPLSAS